MAVPVIESYSQEISALAFANSGTVSKPTGTASGDLLLFKLSLANDQSSSAAQPALTMSGFTIALDTVASLNDQSAWAWKIAGGSEPSSYSYSWTSNGRLYIGTMFRISGHDATTPINAVAALDGIVSPSITTTVNDCLLLFSLSTDRADRTATVPSGTTLQSDGAHASSTSTFRTRSVVASLAGGTAGSTGTKSWTSTAGATSYATSIAIAPTAGGGPTNYPITAGAGSYALTGTAATLKVGRKVAAAAGSYALTGTAATLKLGKTIAAAAGSYSLTGQPATLRRTRLIGAGSGSYALSGTAATLKATKLIAANGGTYTLTGTAATLRAGRVVAAAAGAYTLTGQPATLTYVPIATAYELVAGVGSYALTGSTATLRTTRLMAAGAGSYSLTGLEAGLIRAAVNENASNWVIQARRRGVR